MKKGLAGCLLVLLFAGCGMVMRSQDISNVTKSETVILKKLPTQGSIHSLTINGVGRISGDAEVVLILNGVPYKKELLSGDVAFRWDGDWYADQAEIRYTVKSVAGGNLQLNYTFHDLK